MPTRAEDLEIINNLIFPCLLGTKPFKDVLPHQMDKGFNETAIFQALLSNLRPNCAIEIGTETGAKLAMMAKYSKRVISIDIDPKVKTSLSGHFPNAEFFTGDSRTLIPEVLGKLAEENTAVDFIFLDGNHSESFVRQDVENILSYRPACQMLLLMHDTFNPDCRKGVLSANWARNSYCHFVDLDFSPGILHPNEGILREMWGGLGLALFRPTPRTHNLEVKTTHQLLYEAAFLQSVHHSTSKRAPSSLFDRVFGSK
jgi:hypothetical protein